VAYVALCYVKNSLIALRECVVINWHIVALLGFQPNDIGPA
jgi:hypothetical protein